MLNTNSIVVGVWVVTPPLDATSVTTSPEPICELVAFGNRLNSLLPPWVSVPSSPAGASGPITSPKPVEGSSEAPGNGTVG